MGQEPFLSCAKVLGDHDRRTSGNRNEKNKQQVYYGQSSADCREGFVSYILSYDYGVNRAVELLREISD